MSMLISPVYGIQQDGGGLSPLNLNPKPVDSRLDDWVSNMLLLISDYFSSFCSIDMNLQCDRLCSEPR